MDTKRMYYNLWRMPRLFFFFSACMQWTSGFLFRLCPSSMTKLCPVMSSEGFRCQIDHRRLQVCHLSQPSGWNAWQPALHQRLQTLRMDKSVVNCSLESAKEKEWRKTSTCIWHQRHRVTVLSQSHWHQSHRCKSKTNYPSSASGIGDQACLKWDVCHLVTWIYG